MQRAPERPSADLTLAPRRHGSGLELLKPRDIVRTGPVDHADWNYRPILGAISRQRFKMALSLLPPDVGAMLEVGYGSGLFLPELASHCRTLYGLDVHDREHDVAAILASVGIRADLRRGSATAMPFPTAMFDCIVAISALEFVDDPVAASRELSRTLAPNGRLIVVTPGHSWLLDLGLKLLAGQVARRDYGLRRELLLPALAESFTVERHIQTPSFTFGLAPLYRGLRLRPKR
jgi:SAM-dependent methyltransferase